MRTALLAVVALATSAFATGERIQVSPASNPLRDTLCISMTCGNNGDHDARVVAKPTKNAVEFTVTTRSGKVALVERAGVDREGRVSSTDLVRVTSAVLQAIESKGEAKPDSKSPRAAARKRSRARG